MNKRTYLLIFMLLSISFFHKQASATGLGPFVYFGGNTVEMQGMKNIGTIGIGAGLLVDTRVARDRVLNKSI